MTEPLNDYIAFFNGRQHEIRASSLYDAKLAAIAFFRPRRSSEHMVSVVLAQIGDKPVIHSTGSL